MKQARFCFAEEPLERLRYRAGRKEGRPRAYVQNRKLRLAGFVPDAHFRVEQLGPRRWALCLDSNGPRKVHSKKRSQDDVIPIVDVNSHDLDFTVGKEFEVQLYDGMIILVQTFSAEVELPGGGKATIDGVRITDADGRVLDAYMYVEFAGGMGLLDYAARLAGGTPTLSFEVDEDAYTQHHDNLGNTVVLGDVREFSPADIKNMLAWFETPSRRVRFAIAGLPCEPWTGIRLHEGAEKTGPRDDRNLFPWFLSVMEHLRLEAFLIENVPGLVLHYRDYLKAHILQPLQEMGYHLTLDANGLPPILRARDYGCPSDRDRVFILGSLHGTIQLPGPTHGPGRAHPYVSMLEVLSDLLEDEPAEADDLPPRLRWYCAERPDPTGKFKTELFRSGVDCLISGNNYNKRGPQFRPLTEPAFTLLSSDAGRSWIRYKGKLRRLKAHHAKRLVGCPDWFTDVTLDRLGDAVPVPLGLVVTRALIEHLRAYDAGKLSA